MDDRLKEIYQEILKNTPKHSSVVENMNETNATSTTKLEKSVSMSSKYFKTITVFLVILISAYFIYNCFCKTSKINNTKTVKDNMREELLKQQDHAVTDDDDYDEDDDDSIVEDNLETNNDPLFQTLE